MRRHLYRALAVGTLLLLTSAPASADPNVPGTLPPHRHYIVTPDGTRIEVGPDVCNDPTLRTAFTQFHLNVHAPMPPFIGENTGPDVSAPGLHNGYGAELIASGC